MRNVFVLASLLVAAAPSALADIPSPEPVGKRWLPLVIAVVVAVAAALFAYARLVRRRSAAAPAITGARSKDA